MRAQYLSISTNESGPLCLVDVEAVEDRHVLRVRLQGEAGLLMEDERCGGSAGQTEREAVVGAELSLSVEIAADLHPGPEVRLHLQQDDGLTVGHLAHDGAHAQRHVLLAAHGVT